MRRSWILLAYGVAVIGSVQADMVINGNGHRGRHDIGALLSHGNVLWTPPVDLDSFDRHGRQTTGGTNLLEHLGLGESVSVASGTVYLHMLDSLENALGHLWLDGVKEKTPLAPVSTDRTTLKIVHGNAFDVLAHLEARAHRSIIWAPSASGTDAWSTDYAELTHEGMLAPTVFSGALLGNTQLQGIDRPLGDAAP